MVSKPPSNRIVAEQPDPRNTGHPLLRSPQLTADLLARSRGLQQNEEVIIERIEEWKDSLNRLASTSDGQHMLKMMIKYAGIYNPRDTSNTVKMVEDAGKANFYLKMVRPYLDSSLRKEIEP